MTLSIKRFSCGTRTVLQPINTGGDVLGGALKTTSATILTCAAYVLIKALVKKEDTCLLCSLVCTSSLLALLWDILNTELLKYDSVQKQHLCN